MNAEFIQLLHLADSALPTGGFAFSSGLESAAKTGLIRTTAEFTGHVRAALAQAADFDLPIINSLFEDDECEDAIQRFDLMMRVPTLRKASTVQGRGWLRLFSSMYPQVDAKAIKAKMRVLAIPLHFPIVMTLTMKESGFSLQIIRQLYIYLILRDQISSAIRLGIIGPGRGHSILAGLTEYCEQLQQQAETKRWRDAVRTTAMLDVAQMYHQKIYSKLFQN